MSHSPRSSRPFLALLALLCISGCGKEGYGEKCKSNGDCEDGLNCAKPSQPGGWGSGFHSDEGLCTLACDSSVTCKNTLGGEYYCREENCQRDCSSDSQCPGVLVCRGICDYSK